MMLIMAEVKSRAWKFDYWVIYYTESLTLQSMSATCTYYTIIFTLNMKSTSKVAIP